MSKFRIIFRILDCDSKVSKQPNRLVILRKLQFSKAKIINKFERNLP